MSQNNSNRWWEGYLVRYLMPSIAGIVIVNWLADVAGSDFKNLLFIPTGPNGLDGSKLTLLILYGNLFCYIASYPVLGFHATRVLDFKNSKWPTFLRADSYLLTVVLGVFVLLATLFTNGTLRYWVAFTLVIVFSSLQIYRICISINTRVKVRGLKEPSSLMFGMAYAISKRRGIVEENIKNSSENGNVGECDSDEVKIEDEDTEKVEKIKLIRWRRELIDTYKHMREHGNTAFIFILEIILSGLCFCLVSVKGKSPIELISSIGILFALWALPSFFIHMAGQHLERRFSLFDRRVKNNNKVQGI